MNVSPNRPQIINPDGTVNGLLMTQMIDDLRNGVITLWLSGTTAQRPNDPVLGQLYYDTTLGAFVYASAIRNGAIAAVWSPVAAVSNTPHVTVLTGSGNYTPLTDCLLITAVGAGGGNTAGNSGGGSGEFTRRRIYNCTAATPIAYVVGQGASAANGGATTFGSLSLAGGLAGVAGVFGNGGGRLGATSVGVAGTAEGVDSWGGSAGGNGATKGGPFDIFVNAGLNSGACSYWGPGGASLANAPAGSFGAGGGNATTAGANGTIIVEEIGN